MTATAWATSLDQFSDEYGGEPDFNDATDRDLFLGILEEEIRGRIEGEEEERDDVAS